MAKIITPPIQIENLNTLPTPTSGSTIIGAKSDGLYQKTYDGVEKKFTTDDEVLDIIKLVDGENSGLDADLLDGKHSSYFEGLVSNIQIGCVNLFSTKRIEIGALESTFIYRCDSELIKCSEDYYTLDSE